MRRRIGIIGYGSLGKYLVSNIQSNIEYEMSFIWNRTRASLEGIDESLILENLDDFASRFPDLVIEVAHPCISKSHGKLILQYCDYMIGSPSALTDNDCFEELKNAAVVHGLYVPSGAFWGGEDIKKISEAGNLQSLKVTMRQHPDSLKLLGHLKDRNAEVQSEAVTLYQGCVRAVCPLAPNNTNTMAVAALAAPNLGFDGVIGCLVSDPSLVDYHMVEVEVYGYPTANGSRFHCHTIRTNPALKGNVSGESTKIAYLGSLKRAAGKGPGLHLC